MVTRPVSSDVKTPGLEGLSIKGAFGRWLKAQERWLSVEDLYRTYKKWNDNLYQEVSGTCC